jgi:hypothetical protein
MRPVPLRRSSIFPLKNLPMEISGFIALLVAMIVGRIISERGYRTLNSEEKVRLMDGFSKTRAYSMIPILILIGAYYLLMTKTDFDKTMISIGYFSLLIVYIIFRSIMSHKKLSSMDLPATCRRYFTISQTVSLVGVAWFFYTIFAKKFGA